jgi:hypothetical protein
MHSYTFMYFHLIHVAFQNIREHQGAFSFQESGRNLKVEGNIWVECSKFCIEDSYVLGTTIQNLVSWATWLPGFMRLCA